MNCPACGAENINGSDRCENCLAPFRDLDVPRADAAEGLARSVMEDKLSQLDLEVPIAVSPETPAVDVIKLMKQQKSGCALVLENACLRGIFTEHDMLLNMTGANACPPLTTVKALMSPYPETLHEQDSVATALNKMSIGQYRHIPVKKADGSYTVASIKSVLKYIAQEDW
ncbi:MAG TPA: CBS domain-containing protein [Pyrinomonadaceae bacterium]|nr:CBS domain-containing protein [Pyrinomonadaceae bacterium]